ncbi:MAG: gamma-glutamylcyclotransferase [Haloarculaceae archaeon]
MTRDLVFVYGTLTDESRVADLLDSYRFVGDAVCRGLTRLDGRYPTLAPGEAGETVSGRLLETPERERLDRYEGVDRGLYHRFTLPVETESEAISEAALESEAPVEHDTASVYIGAPTGLGIDPPAEHRWPGEEAFADRVAAYLSARAVEVVKK